MKVLVFGATGGTGKEIVAQARAAGHDVLPFTRAEHGDVTADRDAVSRAVRGQDAVISALGRGNSFKSEQLMARAMDVILPAMQREGVRRLVAVSAFGVGESFYEAPLLAKIFFRTALRHIYADKAIADDFVRRSGLDWTLVYPTRLTSGPRTGRYRVGEHFEPGSATRISRADVAEFVVRQLTDPSWLRKTVIIST
jgi:putative NADH-flavin reductase